MNNGVPVRFDTTSLYPVNELFLTVQGEGYWAGRSAVFVRLQGCPVGCPWCFVGDTQVLMEDWSTKALRDVQVGDMVMGYRNRQYTSARVLDTTQHAADTVSVNLADRTVQCTPEHVFHVNHHRSGGVRKAQAADLAGMWVKASKMGGTAPEPDTPNYERGYLMGMFTGDGSVRRQGRYRRAWLSSTDIEIAERVADLLNGMGRNVSVTTARRPTKARKAVYRVSTGSVAGADDDLAWLLAWPENREQARGWIAGFFDAEGSVRRSSVALYQKDGKLLKRVQALLEQFDIAASLTEGADGMHQLVITALRDADRFMTLFNPVLRRKAGKLRSDRKRFLEPLRVREVRPAGTAQVFNLMTSSGNFFADGLLVDQCDTKHTWEVDAAKAIDVHAFDAKPPEATAEYAWLSAEQIVERVTTESDTHEGLVVITGGEPLLYDLRPLCKALAKAYCHVQVESSGSHEAHIGDETWLTVSPKVGMPGGFSPHALALARANEIKMPVAAARDLHNLLDLCDRQPRPWGPQVPVFVQPVSTRPRALGLCIEAVHLHGFRLSVQTHALLGLR